MLYVVKYTGPFGYLKPWTAVRDELTQSQQFLTPSTVSGINQKLFGLGAENHILRHRLRYGSMEECQEQTWAKLRKLESGKMKSNGILKRVVMVEPVLHLAFDTYENAAIAKAQHICLSRNEDIVTADIFFGEKGIKTMSEDDFEQIKGFELKFDANNPGNPADGTFPVGRHRFIEGAPITYGTLIAQFD